jgi:uncharacterized protein YbbC (DUF1343 family)
MMNNVDKKRNLIHLRMVQFGVDILLQQSPPWKNAVIGMVTNHAATTYALQPSRQALVEAGFNIKTLFSPEHGLDVRGADGHAMQDGTDSLTGLPVISLYGEKLAPSGNDLSGIDILLFDIPDIGARFYTYLWTLSYVIEAAAACRIPLVILDRPNPVSGNMQLAEGPFLEAGNASFIGRWPIPVRHSCTLGELALYFNASRKLSASVQVIPCEGWDRNSFQPDWGIPFVPTSPAIRDFQSMLLYPGLCMLEATNISEGRGTAQSFRVAGAPWIDGPALAGILNETGLEDLHVKSCEFTPAEGKYALQRCHGVAFEVTQPHYFQSVTNGLLLIKLIQSMYPQQFSWATYPTHVNPSGKQHLDKLTGLSNSEALFSLSLPAFMAAITKHARCADWKGQIQEYLLYE